MNDINRERADKLSVLVKVQNAEIRRLRRRLQELEDVKVEAPPLPVVMEIPILTIPEAIPEPKKKVKKKESSSDVE